MPVAIEQIVETLNQQRTSLVGYAWVVVGDAQLADDVYQDISLAAIKKADQIKDAAHLLPWLRTAIRLRGLEIRRNRGRQAALLSPELLDLFENTQTALTQAKESDRMASLRHCIDAMPKRSRELLDLRYNHDPKPKQIAEQAGKSDQAIYKSIQRIHLSLGNCIKQRLKTQAGSPSTFSHIFYIEDRPPTTSPPSGGHALRSALTNKPAASTESTLRGNRVAALTAQHNATWSTNSAAGASALPVALTTGSKLYPSSRLTLTAGFTEIAAQNDRPPPSKRPRSLSFLTTMPRFRSKHPDPASFIGQQGQNTPRNTP